MAGQFAYRLSLLAFAVSTIRGLITGSDFQGALKWALVAAAAFFALGFVVAEFARLLVEDNARSEFARLRLARQPAGTLQQTSE